MNDKKTSPEERVKQLEDLCLQFGDMLFELYDRWKSQLKNTPVSPTRNFAEENNWSRIDETVAHLKKKYEPIRDKKKKEEEIETNIRVFGSSTCEECKKVLTYFKKINWSYEYVDADAYETQELCDEHEIGRLPHVQFRDDDGNVADECIGLDALRNKMKETLNKVSKELGLDKL